MPATVLTAAEIRDNILRDRQNLQPDQTIDISSDSDNYARAAATGSAIEGLYAYQQWQTRQIFPDSADPEMLLRHASIYNMSLKPAVAASGAVRITGAPGTGFASGLPFTYGSLSYVTTSEGTIGTDGNATVTARASQTGSASNITSAVQVQLTAAPPGIQSAATLLTMTSGLEIETYDALLGRLLDRMRNPPGAGKASDYRIWAMEIPGITGAYVFPHRVAIGRVDIAVISGTGLPGPDEIAAAQLNIDLKRPAACRAALVFAPELVTVDHLIRADLSGITTDDLRSALAAPFASYYDTLVPGSAVVKSKLESIVSDTQGVLDRTVVTPAANIATVVDSSRVQWARLGEIVVEAM